jgi:hypothetical protein
MKGFEPPTNQKAGFDKIAGSDFEPPQAGREAVKHREVFHNPFTSSNQ